MLAEDDGALRSVIAEALADAGLSVVQAPDGAAAYKMLKENPQPHILLLTDIRMPNMDGFELAEAAIALNPEIKLLMLTGYAEMTVSPAALRAREVRILRKPIDLDRLCELVTDMLARP